MNKLAGLLALTLASLSLAAGCTAAPDTGDKDYSTPSKSKKDTNDDGEEASLPNKTKSDTSAPAPSDTPAPSPAPPATPSAPATPPPATPTTPAVDLQACANLGQCCSELTNTFGQLACLGVQLKGDPETCTKSLLACRATIGLGGIGGGAGAGACDNDNDCPGAEICVQNTCR